jgi:hypothetical protein
MDHEQKQEDERIRRIVVEAQMIQTKRTVKALAALTVMFFAIQGIVALYRFFF